MSAGTIRGTDAKTLSIKAFRAGQEPLKCYHQGDDKQLETEE